MAKMEEEHNAQNTNNVSSLSSLSLSLSLSSLTLSPCLSQLEVVSDLETRIQEMTREIETLSKAHSSLAQDKV